MTVEFFKNFNQNTRGETLVANTSDDFKNSNQNLDIWGLESPRSWLQSAAQTKTAQVNRF